MSSGDHLGVIWGSSGDHLGVIWGSSGDHLGIICGSFGGHRGIILGSSRDRLGLVWGSSGGHLEVIWGSSGSSQVVPESSQSEGPPRAHLADQRLECMHTTEVQHQNGALARLSEASFSDLRAIAVFYSVPPVIPTDPGKLFKTPSQLAFH